MAGRPGDRICLGVVVGPHGVKGAVKIKAFTERPEQIAAYGPLGDDHGGGRFELTLVGPAKGGVVARIAGIEDRDAAAALKGRRLYVARGALPAPEDAEQYYHADLIGLAAERPDGTPLGRVRAVHDFGAGDVLELDLADPGKRGTVMVPFTRAVVPTVDLAAGRLVVDPPPGLLDDGARPDEAGYEGG